MACVLTKTAVTIGSKKIPVGAGTGMVSRGIDTRTVTELCRVETFVHVVPRVLQLEPLESLTVLWLPRVVEDAGRVPKGVVGTEAVVRADPRSPVASAIQTLIDIDVVLSTIGTAENFSHM